MIGKIVTSGKLAVSDPCYKEPSVILDVEAGGWFWGVRLGRSSWRRPQNLYAYHEDYRIFSDDINEEVEFLPVDSGLMGIRDIEEVFDQKRLTELMFPNGNTCEDGAVQYSDRAAASGTYYGDGCYPLFVGRNGDGKIVALLVDFMDEYDED